MPGVIEATPALSPDRDQRAEQEHLGHPPVRGPEQRAHRLFEVRRPTACDERHEHGQPQQDDREREDERGGRREQRDRLLAGLPGDCDRLEHRDGGAHAAQIERGNRERIGEHEHDQRCDAERELSLQADAVATVERRVAAATARDQALLWPRPPMDGVALRTDHQFGIGGDRMAIDLTSGAARIGSASQANGLRPAGVFVLAYSATRARPTDSRGRGIHSRIASLQPSKATHEQHHLARRRRRHRSRRAVVRRHRLTVTSRPRPGAGRSVCVSP